MIFHQVIARRYAQGLFLSIPKDDIPKAKDLAELVKVFQNEDLVRLFNDPKFSLLEKKGVTEKLAQKLLLNKILSNFLILLVKKRRISLLPDIMHSFMRLIDESTGTKRALIKSASVLNDKEVSSITTMLAAIFKKQIISDATVDESLLGGIRVEIAGTIFDGTVKAKLLALKNKLVSME